MFNNAQAFEAGSMQKYDRWVQRKWREVRQVCYLRVKENKNAESSFPWMTGNIEDDFAGNKLMIEMRYREQFFQS